MSGAPRPVLAIHDVVVRYGGVRAVESVSINIHEDSIFGILGPNGSGKSSLLAAVTRLVELASGTLSFDGTRYEQLPAAAVSRLGIARTFQTVRLLPDLTVRENVALGADATRRESAFGHRRRGRRSSNGRVDKAIERVGLTSVSRHRPTELSYGTQRRVEIARAIAASPRLLLLDEPTAGMNPRERGEIAELFRELRAEGLTQLIVEHDVQMMVDTCDYLFAMNQGSIIGEGQPADVVRMAAVQDAYLGTRWRDAHR